MAATIRLVRKAPDALTLPPGMQHVWPLTVEATGVEIPSEIFVWHAVVAGEVGDMFEAVASVPQLETIPLETRRVLRDGSVHPYYRTWSITLACRNQAEADEVWTKLQEDAQRLVNNWNLFSALSSRKAVDLDGSNTTVVEDSTDEPTREVHVLLADFVFDEVPTGLINGTNRAFQIANTPALGTLQVFLNGMRVYGGVEQDYELAGSQITFASAPSDNSRLTADYIIAS